MEFLAYFCFMKTIVFVFGLFLFFSCKSDKEEKLEEKSDISYIEKNYPSLRIKDTDTSQSYIQIPFRHFGGRNIKIQNVTYTQEFFRYDKELQQFVCKTTSIGNMKSSSRQFYYEKKEFFDYDMNKIFELEAKQRKIILHKDYYVTEDLIHELPEYFELNSYQSKKPFIKVTGSMCEVEIPGTPTKAFFGYRHLPKPNADNVIGIVYYSINQTENYQLLIKAKNKNIYKVTGSFIGLEVLPKNKKDKEMKYPYWTPRDLSLKSKFGKKGKEYLSDFDLVLSMHFNVYDGDVDNTHKKYHIPIINGLMYGQEAKNGKYEYIIEKVPEK